TIEDRKKSNTTGPWESCDSGNDEEKRKGKNNRLERRVVDYKAPKGKSKNKDTTFKNPIKGRGTKIPIVVDKETSQVEKNYTHEKWLEMSGSELGARASDYIGELERQRKICGNLSGNVEGRMKDCTFVLSKLCEAFTEKTEILDLERQVNSLKEGNSVYASRTLMDGMEDPKEKRTKNERMKTNVRKSPYVKLTDVTEVHCTPGCSSDVDYMSRKDDYPEEENAMEWTSAEQDQIVSENEYKENIYR
ncbi:ornithine mitochondrial-like protein, partial [Lasius niger]